MGVVGSKSIVKQQYAISVQIDIAIREEEKRRKPTKLLLLGSSSVRNSLSLMSLLGLYKIIILGAGECGKSTILKQMRIIHLGGFTREERLQRRFVIINNIVQSVYHMLVSLPSLKLFLDTAELKKAEKNIRKVIDDHEILDDIDDELYKALTLLWNYEGLQKAYARRSEIQLEDSVKHFLDSLDRIRKADYVPTEQDILLVRVPTSGVVEICFDCKDQEFRVFDVGGQRSERKKWIHCFDDVNAIIFIMSMSEYDQTTREDSITNRMVESFKLFKWTIQNECFVNTAMILFLNKRDLFAEKIHLIPLTVAFPEYQGAQNYESGVQFLRKKFLSANTNPDQTVYVHVTCATDTSQTKIVLDSTFDTVLTKNMQKSGLV